MSAIMLVKFKVTVCKEDQKETEKILDMYEIDYEVLRHSESKDCCFKCKELSVDILDIVHHLENKGIYFEICTFS